MSEELKDSYPKEKKDINGAYENIWSLVKKKKKANANGSKERKMKRRQNQTLTGQGKEDEGFQGKENKEEACNNM